MNEKPPLQAWLLLLLLALVWGSSFILIKKGLVSLSPLEVGSIRMLSASITLLPFVISRFKLIRREKIKYFIAVGLSGSFIPAFLFAIAQTRIESAVTGILNTLTPLFTVLFGLWFFKQRQKASVWIGIVVGFIGSVLLITAGSEGQLSKINFYGFFIIIATMLYATNSNLIKYQLSEYRSVTITSISLFVVGPFAAITLFGFSDFTSKLGQEGTLQAVLYICLLGVLGTAIALIIFNKIVQLTNPVFTSSVTYIIPVIAVVWGLIDGETLLLSHLLGMLAVLIGVYITNQTHLIRKSGRR
ncbi:MAG: EamA family transporter [Cyclobacteriaceae bacterium]|nr:EamA family transporter [Cyclobacteriaceae bacterium SS2]